MFKLKKNRLHLILISFLFLFLELNVIRLIATEIRIFAYLSNLVLLAVFVGSGLGMMLKKKYSLSLTALFLFIITVILNTKFIVRLPNLEFNLFSGITELLMPLSEAHIWLQLETVSHTGVMIGIFLTIFLFWVIAFCFLPIGQFLGRALNVDKNPIFAYSLNIVASLAGMWLFNIFSLIGISPYFCLFLGQFFLLFLIQKKNDSLLATMALLATLVLLLPRSASQPGSQPVTFWSPYQKIVFSLIEPQKPYQAEGWFLEVNNAYHMALLDLSTKALKEREFFIKNFFKNNLDDWEFTSLYSLPYKFNPQPQDVLIIGGGGGNDAAAALRAQAKDITVVEIDPAIIRLGRRYHPEKPYSQENVRLIINDGRAFFQTTDKKFDLIIFSLADSHTLSSSLTNLRLDNYLYTQESLTRVKDLLKDDGLLFLSFAVGRPWVGARLKKTIGLAFNQEPKIFEVESNGVFGWGGIVFVAAKDHQVLEEIINENEKLQGFISQKKRDFDSSSINPLSDDWPYHYLDKKRLPLIHLLTAFFIMAGLLIFKLKTLKKKSLAWSFFFLGIAFMLFEFQNISKSGLIFGNTWVTNLFIITGVLIFILLANLSVYKKMISLKWGFIFLFISLFLQLIVPLGFFNSLKGWGKISSSSLFLTLPHFFSGVIFVSLFAKAKNKAVALGSNLLGSAIGGLMEMFSFLWGINSLLYLVICFYGLGMIFSRKK